MYIYGRKPVLEAVKAGVPIAKLYIQYGFQGEKLGEIIGLARRKKIPIVELPKVKLESLVESHDTQGIVALKNSITFESTGKLVENALKEHYPFLILLDSIQDPHNLGAILRTSKAAGAHGVIVTKYGSTPITPVVVKVSAGAAERIPIAQADNLVNEIKYLKERGFWIIGSTLNNSENYLSTDFKRPIALILGNEEKGIRPVVAKNCDILVTIPMYGDMESLNVSVAAGILLFEIKRQQSL